MTKFLARVGRYTFLVALTVFACGVMWWVSQKSDESDALGQAAEVAPTPLAAQPRTLVRAVPVEAAIRDVVVRYSGKIQPWETFSLGFEIGGRVANLGENAAGEPLDDGDRVEAGQLLARLDDRIFRARLAEAVANFEMASSDVARSRRVRERNPGAITEAEYQNDVTLQAQAQAAQRVAEKNLEDSLLTSPVTGKIARRMVEAGESVNPNATVFEIVENDRLRLVVNIPEARVRELELRRREVAEARRNGAADSDPESGVFRAHVRLEGNDLYGNEWPIIEAEVYRIAQVADDVTGLFEVEIAIDNSEGLLRPGMVATAAIVTDRVDAYALPEPAVLFRSGITYAFTIENQTTELPVMMWDVGETEVQRARRINLTKYIDQGEMILIPADAVDLSSIITRGQERLRDGQLVRAIEPETPGKTVASKP
ncbi:MAG: efflux RND transporter periplasmic adaptor subunit [Planctomycetota bacterium]